MFAETLGDCPIDLVVAGTRAKGNFTLGSMGR